MGAQKGILIISSVGNERTSGWEYLVAPADARDVLGVGAVDIGGEPAGFSSRGPSFDGRVKPDVVACGAEVPLVNSYGAVVTGNGTSYSAPIICGLSACLLQAFPVAGINEIINSIRASAHRYDFPDNFVGYGIPDFFRAYEMLRGTITHHIPKHQEWFVYPNPVKEVLNIKSKSGPGNAPVIYRLYNALGTGVITSGLISSGNVISGWDEMAQGVYFLYLSDGKRSEIHKIIKQ